MSLGSEYKSEANLDEIRQKELSKRELEILKLLAKGLMHIDIAAILAVTPATIEDHIKNLYTKLGMRSQFIGTSPLGAVLTGVDYGFIDPAEIVMNFTDPEIGTRSLGQKIARLDMQHHQVLQTAIRIKSSRWRDLNNDLGWKDKYLRNTLGRAHDILGVKSTLQAGLIYFAYQTLTQPPHVPGG